MKVRSTVTLTTALIDPLACKFMGCLLPLLSNLVLVSVLVMPPSAPRGSHGCVS